MNGNHPDDIITIGQNNEKSPENLRKLAVTPTPVKDHQVALVGKAHKERDFFNIQLVKKAINLLNNSTSNQNKKTSMRKQQSQQKT